MKRNSISKILNDPVYGFITLNKGILLNIVDHPFFQRLSRIKQLGLTYLVYPGAHHTRFHHAIGASHLMSQAIQTLKQNEVAINKEEEEAVILAILLHDIGHGPFSHALENSFIKGVSHEDISIEFMNSLNKEFDGALDLALEIFQDKYSKGFLHDLVSSQLDMDRLDYLKRDSFFTGVSEGVVSNERIIKMFAVANDELVVREKGIYSIEKFIVARRLMYWQVYLHKTVLSAEFLLAKILERAREIYNEDKKLFMVPNMLYFLEKKITKENYQDFDFLKYFSKLDDFDVFTCIKVWAESKDKVISKLSNMLINRNLLKVQISSKKFSSEKLEKIKLSHQKNLGITAEEINYFVFQKEMTNNAYDPRKDKIKILFNNGLIKDITLASDNLNISALSKPVKKYYLFAPNF
ncbi:MAG: HD domain-containing protein [Flavobacteriales bacterium]|jgi:HD superfamily phosphohydrolase|nr:HD domain-containing protein [Flavobacteriales bacterium]MDG1440056.1 HD domain-containing protein [Flavobacteriales bacterium]MDG1798681.1 HD domain-containing protein [Flavobacteriales bacterium]